MLYTTLPSPLGDLLLTGDGETVSGLHLVAGPARRARDGNPLPPGGTGSPPNTPGGWRRSEGTFAQARRQLQQYFAGERRWFDLPLAPAGTPFEHEVWAALRQIPYGETVSYAELAASIKRPRAARAVGLANGRNPIAVIVPCHRVLGADGSLTGFSGGLERKRLLLDLEAGVMPLAGCT